LQILLGIFLVTLIKVLQSSLNFSYQINPRIFSIHTILGSILAFITVFRTNR